MKNASLFQNESDYADLHYQSAAAHLSQAIRCPTVSYTDLTRIDVSAFDALRAFLRQAYPRVFSLGRVEEIGRSLLITLPGEDPSLKPALFMAHQDVVPIVAGTEGNWLHPPFSGDIADGFIWGRGAMDIKEMLIGELESAEYLLSGGRKPRRTIFLAFGEDEETCSVGARAIARTLRDRGIRLEYVLDEGAGDVTDAADWGAPGALICPIGICEKGYADLRLVADSQGGHSSNPFHGTSLGALSEAITTVIRHLPAPCLTDSVRRSLQLLAPVMAEAPIRDWAQDPDAHEAELLAWFLRHESLYHLVQTTAAPTMITLGSPAGNVMPQRMEAVINFRLIPQDTPDSLLAQYRALLDDRIRIDWAQQIGASVPSDVDAYGYTQLNEALRHYFNRLTFLPMQNRGA
ncbi:MAG: M20/M25/M40 family metallo-hydrolase, partial [Clostridia bacterium]|nr:M20/M25/M40 family metallo-hydrolase [Clostridia bacterium]